jgi:uncharacterized protein YjiS (DUF1127 family)
LRLDRQDDPEAKSVPTVLQRKATALRTVAACQTKEKIMFQPITRRLWHWHLRNTTRRKLSQLDDRLLADIGTNRNSIGEFVAAQPLDGA